MVGAGYTIQRTRYYQTKGPMKKLARLVAYGNTKSIARFVLKDLMLRTHTKPSEQAGEGGTASVVIRQAQLHFARKISGGNGVLHVVICVARDFHICSISSCSSMWSDYNFHQILTT